MWITNQIVFSDVAKDITRNLEPFYLYFWYSYWKHFLLFVNATFTNTLSKPDYTNYHQMKVFITYYSKIFHSYIYRHLISYNPWYNPMQILDTYNLYLNYCLAYASIIFIQSKMTRGIKLQFISIMVERTKAKSTQSIYFLRILTNINITSTFGYAQIQRINN